MARSVEELWAMSDLEESSEVQHQDVQQLAISGILLHVQEEMEEQKDGATERETETENRDKKLKGKRETERDKE
jgi:hypothetical protein